MKREKIIAVIPFFHPKRDEIDNVTSYLDDLDGCVIMDDSENDNSSMFDMLLKENEGKVYYYWNGKNIGLTASVNKGFKIAIKHEAEWILVMNPDGTFETDALSVYRSFISTHKAAKQTVAVLIPQYNYDRHPRKASSGYKKACYGDMSGSLYNAAVLKKMGFFDEKTYFYGLEEEYCLRVRRNGFKIFQCMEAVINHNPATTNQSKILGLFVFKYGKDAPQRYYYQFRVAFYLLLDHLCLRSLILLVYKSLKVHLFFDQKQEYLRMRKLAWIDYKRGYFGKYESRGI
jgi:rhamnosyltransferase